MSLNEKQFLEFQKIVNDASGAVNAVLRTSVGRHIQDEIILQAKRKLVYTTASVKEIAHSLGFDDYSYFTRLFTKVVGISPTLFRRTYHE